MDKSEARRKIDLVDDCGLPGARRVFSEEASYRIADINEPMGNAKFLRDMFP